MRGSLWSKISLHFVLGRQQTEKGSVSVNMFQAWWTAFSHLGGEIRLRCETSCHHENLNPNLCCQQWSDRTPIEHEHDDIPRQGLSPKPASPKTIFCPINCELFLSGSFGIFGQFVKTHLHLSEGFERGFESSIVFLRGLQNRFKPFGLLGDRSRRCLETLCHLAQACPLLGDQHDTNADVQGSRCRVGIKKPLEEKWKSTEQHAAQSVRVVSASILLNYFKKSAPLKYQGLAGSIWISWSCN